MLCIQPIFGVYFIHAYCMGIFLGGDRATGFSPSSQYLLHRQQLHSMINLCSVPSICESINCFFLDIFPTLHTCVSIIGQSLLT